MSKNLETAVHDIQDWLGAGTVNVFGRPFAGKDCNGKKLAIAIGAPLSATDELIGGGDVLRNSEIPPEVKASMVNGKLIESEAYKQIVLPYLGQSAFIGRPLVLSSVGRSIGEEQGVLDATEASGHPTKVVPFLDITHNETLLRFRTTPDRLRPDDTEAAMYNRLEEFQAKTVPVIEEYERLGLLVRIDAMQEQDIVYRAFIHSLHDFANAEKG